MADEGNAAEESKDPNQEFYDKALTALKELCEKAKVRRNCISQCP
jgi:hypothetical protein